jgi:hypothetical protein
LEAEKTDPHNLSGPLDWVDFRVNDGWSHIVFLIQKINAINELKSAPAMFAIARIIANLKMKIISIICNLIAGACVALSVMPLSAAESPREHL